MPPHPETWLKVTPRGLFCEPGDFYVDPTRAVGRAVITHGHADHARPGHAAVLATPETLAVMQARMGVARAGAPQPLRYGEPLEVSGVRLWLAPAGHVLGSAQVVLEWRGSRVVVSGDYKRQPDPTCPGFEPVPCDVFVTEATFALPVFQHPPPATELTKLLHSLALFPARTHVVASYSLGKTQRLIALLRAAGYHAPIFLHGAQLALCGVYAAHGVALGALRPVAEASREELRGAIVLAPPNAQDAAWAERLSEPLHVAASGWLRLRKRALQSGAELPLIISDHADWDALNRSIDETAAPEVWVTHGREDALVHALAQRGIRGRALHLLGRGDEEAAP